MLKLSFESRTTKGKNALRRLVRIYKSCKIIILILVKKCIFDYNGYGGFPIFLNHDQLHSMAAFFGNGSAVVCCEITRHLDVDDPNPPNVNKQMRQNLWKCYQDGLLDIATIQVEGKEFKVS